MEALGLSLPQMEAMVVEADPYLFYLVAEAVLVVIVQRVV